MNFPCRLSTKELFDLVENRLLNVSAYGCGYFSNTYKNYFRRQYKYGRTPLEIQAAISKVRNSNCSYHVTSEIDAFNLFLQLYTIAYERLFVIDARHGKKQAKKLTLDDWLQAANVEPPRKPPMTAEHKEKLKAGGRRMNEIKRAKQEARENAERVFTDAA